MRLSFLLNHTGGTQTAFKLIHNINTFLDKNIKDDIVIFYENLMKPCFAPKFATMNMADAWAYAGNVIATNLTTANKMILFPSSQRKMFYCIDLEWLYIKDKEYEELANIYQNPHIKLLARSDNHAKIIERVWNRSATVIHDFKIEQFIEVIKNDN